MGDLGFSKQIEENFSNISTQTGTLPYMSPEMREMDKPVENRKYEKYSYKTDIW